MTEALRWPLRLFVIGIFIVLIGLFVDTPGYTNFPEDRAMIRLSFAHGGARDCRDRTAEELASLPPNMRARQICSRSRLPVLVELDLDGSPLYHGRLEPTGLQGDGPSRIYEGFAVPPGSYTLAARLRDSERQDGFDYVAEEQVTLEPRDNLVVDFKSDAGGFVFH